MSADSLFIEHDEEILFKNSPLAVRVRPRSIDEFEGHDDVIGEGTWLYNAIESDSLSSIILFGPPGSGKTSLVKLIAEASSADLIEVPAISGGTAELKKAIESAKFNLIDKSRRTILFVDEIHRFSKSQQDVLLGAVENRILILIGATTENPFFEVNSALNSRSKIIELHALNDEDIEKILDKALVDERGLAGKFLITAKAKNVIVLSSAGDARKALNTLEGASALARSAELLNESENVELAEDEAVLKEAKISKDSKTSKVPQTKKIITCHSIEASSPIKAQLYDKGGDYHYDTISAFIKSMRGSDPDAAVFYLAKMLESGEDPKFIARRIMILASEDIGNADPHALLVAHAAFKATEVIGMPECRINLSQAAIYMALAPKSNASYLAIDSALAEVRCGAPHSVPNHLRDRHRPGSEDYGEYKYPHSYEEGGVKQQYLPDGLEAGQFYKPSKRGWEARATGNV